MRHRSNYSRSRKWAPAFTLIELLVVISIIALLLAILVPALRKAKDLAERAVCLSNCRQWATATVAYASENNDSFPIRTSRIAGETKAQWGWTFEYYNNFSCSGNDYWYNLLDPFLKPYVGQSEFLMCPGVKRSPEDIRGDINLRRSALDWDLQIKVSTDKWGYGRVFGDYGFFTTYDCEAIKVTRPGYVYWGSKFVSPPHDTITEEFYVPTKLSWCRPSVAIAGDSIYRAGDSFGGWGPVPHPFRAGRSIHNHPPGMNASFVDGSARWVDYEDMTYMFQLVGGDMPEQGAFWPDPRR